MNEAKAISEDILKDVEEYSKKYTGITGKDTVTKDSLTDLQNILSKGLSLYNYLVSKDLYQDKPAIHKALFDIQTFINQLTINQTNAQKLNLSNAIQLWNQSKIAIAVLASNVIDYKEGVKSAKPKAKTKNIAKKTSRAKSKSK